MAKEFSPQTINEALTRIYKKYNFTPLYQMSTSGDYVVVQVKNKFKEKYIIKLRKRSTSKSYDQFYKEAVFFKFLSKQAIPLNYSPPQIIVNTKTKPEYIIYSYINSHPLNGYYFYIGRRRKKIFYQTNLGSYLNHIQLLTNKFINSHPQIKLTRLNFNYLLKQFDLYLSACKTIIPSKHIKEARQALLQEKKFIQSSPLVLSHGDFNPKNILIGKNGISIIDWSDLALANPCYDLAMISLALWEDPALANQWKFDNLSALKTDINKQKLFLLNQLFLFPRFIKIIQDSIAGLEDDKNKNIISQAAYIKVKEIAKQALRAAQENFLKLNQSYWDNFAPSPINSHIELFSNKNFVQKFLKQNQQKLQLKSAKLVELKIIKRDFVKISKRLIAEYKLPYKRLIAKIKIERGDDLAWQSFVVFSAINNHPASRGMAPLPLHFFSKYNLLIYQKKSGKLLSEAQGKIKISPAKLGEEIAKSLSALHSLPLTSLKQIKLLRNYDTKEQINFLYNHENNFSELKKFKLKTIAKKLDKIYQQIKTNQPVFIHGDLQPQNIILSPRNKIGFIDFDNGLFDDPLVDVGNFIIQAPTTGLSPLATKKLRESFVSHYFYLNNLSLEDKFVNQRLNFYLIMGLVKNLNFHIYFYVQLKQKSLIPKDLQKIKLLLKYINESFNHNSKIIQ